MKRQLGFTLLELMIVVGIVAILAAMAYNAYNGQVRKSRRAEAKQALSELALRQEKWRSNHANYRGANSSAADITAFGTLPNPVYYTIAITSNEAPAAYTMTATPKSGTDQTKDKCGTYTFSMASGQLSRTTSSGTLSECY